MRSTRASVRPPLYGQLPTDLLHRGGRYSKCPRCLGLRSVKKLRDRRVSELAGTTTTRILKACIRRHRVALADLSPGEIEDSFGRAFCGARGLGAARVDHAGSSAYPVNPLADVQGYQVIFSPGWAQETLQSVPIGKQDYTFVQSTCFYLITPLIREYVCARMRACKMRALVYEYVCVRVRACGCVRWCAILPPLSLRV